MKTRPPPYPEAQAPKSRGEIPVEVTGGAVLVNPFPKSGPVGLVVVLVVVGAVNGAEAGAENAVAPVLDAAVFDAYGWPHDLSDDEILARLLALNLARAAGQGEVDAAVEAEEDDGDK